MKILFVQMMNPFPPQSVMEENTTRLPITIVYQRKHDVILTFLLLIFSPQLVEKVANFDQKMLLSVTDSTYLQMTKES